MPADAHTTRRQTDLAKVQELQNDFLGAVAVKNTYGNPVSALEIQLNIPTAKNSRYPTEVQPFSTVRIQLPARYPFEPPNVSVTTPVWNPNIFPSGAVCLGQRWIPSHNLALLVQRVMQILALDPTIINLASPANGEAAKWYAGATRHTPSLFPTTRIDSLRTPAKRTIQWKTIK